MAQVGINEDEAKSVSERTRPTRGSVKIDQCAQAFSESAEGTVTARSRASSQALQERTRTGNHGWAEKLHRNRQPQGSGRGVTCAELEGLFMSQKPNFSEVCPEAAIREGANELTLRAEEVKNGESVHQHRPR